MSSTEGDGPPQEANDRWLGSKGLGQVEVGVKYTVRGNGEVTTKWDVDTRKATPSPLPNLLYRWCSTVGDCSNAALPLLLLQY